MAPVTRSLRPVRHPVFLAPLIAAATFAALPPLAAAATGDTPSTRELLRKIEQRDALIEDLQKRVQQLEKQAAPKAPAPPPAAAAPPPGGPPAPAGSPPAKAAAAPAGAPPGQPPAPGQKAAKAGPGQFEVDEEAAQRALERTLVITGALLLPYGQLEVQPGFNYVRQQVDFPALANTSTGTSVVSVSSRSDIIGGSAFIRLGLPFDSQLELYVPYQSIDRQTLVEQAGDVANFDSTKGTGFGDVRLGLAKTLLAEKHWWPDVIARVTWDSDSGQTPNSVVQGTGYSELQGSITVTKRQDPLVFLGNVSYESAFEKDNIRPGDVLGFSLGAVLAASPETSLRVILNQNFIDDVEVNGRGIKGSDRVSSTLNFGASSIVGRAKFLDFTAGIGLTKDSPDYTVGVSFAMRFDLPFLPALESLN
jgi:hypothetical protein